MPATSIIRAPQSSAGDPPLLRACGDVDRTCYLDLVAAAERLHASGAVRLRIDLSRATGISLSGVVGLYAIAELFDGRPLPFFDDGWGTIRRLGEPVPERAGTAPVALTGLTGKVRETLARTRLLPRFRIHEPAVDLPGNGPGGRRRVHDSTRREPVAAALRA